MRPWDSIQKFIASPERATENDLAISINNGGQQLFRTAYSGNYNHTMRFHLRTLLFAMAVIGIVLARVAYLKNQRDFHRDEAQRLALPLLDQGVTLDGINMRLRDAAALGPDVGHGGPKLQLEARKHAILAKRYDQAMYRPWSPVWDDPDSVPDNVGWLDFRVGALLTVACVIALTAWQLIPRPRDASSLTGDAPWTQRLAIRFTIRDWLWLTIVVVLTCAWQMQLTTARRAEWHAKREASRADNAEHWQEVFRKNIGRNVLSPQAIVPSSNKHALHERRLPGGHSP